VFVPFGEMSCNNARTGIVGITVIAGLIVLGFLYTRPGHAQTPAVAGPQEFDIASVKLNKSAADSSSTAFARGGAFTARNATLRGVIQEAYDLKDDRLLGGPDWVGYERYDIIAKPESRK
jgi:hypothetical protein